MVKEKIFNIPNLLSFYRILIFPFILWLIFDGQVKLYAVFVCINIVTDFLDGKIARYFNMVTSFGARLDSYADYGTLFLSFFGIIKFKSADLLVHGWFLYFYIVLMALVQIFSFIKFRSFTSLHLYSFKGTGYLLAPLFFCWFFIKFYPWLYYLAIGIGILAEIETFFILLIIKERISDARGLYWILKRKNG